MAATDFVTEQQVDSLVTNIATKVKATTTAASAAQSAIDAHIADTTAAHAATAVSYAGSTNLSSTTVEAALDELDAEKASTAQLTAHTGAATGAHAATAISYAGGTGMSATNIEAAVDELATEKADITALNAHINDTTAAHLASAIDIADAGALYTATTVEAALAEVRGVANAAAGGGISINDAATNTTQTWSSQKSTDYVAAEITALIAGAPGALNTLDELAAALGDDGSFATTITNALANRLRFDAAQTLTGPQKAQALANLGIVASAVDFAAAFNTAVA